MEAGAGLRVTNLSKHFGETAALSAVSFEVPRGQVHALLGGNGSGKSTLIKILAGVHEGEPGGRIEVGVDSVAGDHITPAWSRASGLSFVHQDLGLFDQLTVAENLFAGAGYPRRRGKIDWRAMRRGARATLERLGIAVRPEQLLGGMRPADRTLVAIARALHGREQFHEGVLVLDEPTARLPEPEVEMLVATLRGYSAQGQTIVYVSQRLEEVFALALSVTVLRDGRVAASRPIATLDERELITLIVGRAVAETEPMPARQLSPAPLLELRGVHAGPLRDVSLTLSPGEVLGVAGLVGSGRTSLLEAIYGALPIERGSMTVGGHATERRSIAAAIRNGLGYVPEDRAAQAAFLSLGIPENLSAGDPGRYFRRLWFRHRAERRDAAAAISRFGIRAPAVRAPMNVLSGGNQQKVVVARWLQRSPRLLLLDEPTQGVDVGARADIYAHIRAAVLDGAAAIVVSSDFDELLILADRVLVLVGGRMAGEAPTASIDRHWLAERVYAISEEVAA